MSSNLVIVQPPVADNNQCQETSNPLPRMLSQTMIQELVSFPPSVSYDKMLMLTAVASSTTNIRDSVSGRPQCDVASTCFDSIELASDSQESTDSSATSAGYRKAQIVTNKRKYGDWSCPHANYPQSVRKQVEWINQQMKRVKACPEELTAFDQILAGTENNSGSSDEAALAPLSIPNELGCGASLYTCPTCHLHFTRDDAFRRHVRHEHINRPRDFACDQCEKKFLLYHHLNDHKVQFHSGQQGNGMRYRCEHCNVTFVNNSNRRRHVRSVHETQMASSPDSDCS